MANLAITGHATRGKEVIKILEMLGGNNKYAYVADSDCFAFCIGNETGNIYYDWVHSCYEDEDTLVFSLEEFLEKFPYKIGDKVIVNKNIEIINRMRWNGNEIVYGFFTTHNLGELTVDIIQPYKEETMEGKINEGMENLLEDISYNGKIVFNEALPDKTELVLGDSYEIIVEDGKTYVVKKKPQYPTTYEDCCKVLNITPNNKLVFSNPNEESEYAYRNLALYNDLDKLKVCRDAYWKIAGEQMGLGKPWENTGENVYVIGISIDGEAEKNFFEQPFFKYVFSFPTKEILDAFYENFKELIEQCKELL